MEIRVNGRSRSLAEGASVADLLAELSLLRDGVAVERNKEIVKRADWSSTELQHGDAIEIVTLVGGG